MNPNVVLLEKVRDCCHFFDRAVTWWNDWASYENCAVGFMGNLNEIR